jgi:hypothetical protein
VIKSWTGFFALWRNELCNVQMGLLLIYKTLAEIRVNNVLLDRKYV